MKSKKGAEMTIGTIVIIIIALIVLVFLIVGFTMGWGNLTDKIKALIGGGSNVQTVVQGCQLACSSSSAFDYCSKQRDVRFDDEAKDDLKLKYTCYQMEAKNVGLDACRGIDCSGQAKTCVSLGGEWKSLLANTEIKDAKCKDPNDATKEVDSLNGKITAKAETNKDRTKQLCCPKKIDCTKITTELSKNCVAPACKVESNKCVAA